ncbi:hypothetical protein GCM10023310_22720 [Paenibacillus vulneris]
MASTDVANKETPITPFLPQALEHTETNSMATARVTVEKEITKLAVEGDT